MPKIRIVSVDVTGTLGPVLTVSLVNDLGVILDTQTVRFGWDAIREKTLAEIISIVAEILRQKLTVPALNIKTALEGREFTL